MSSRETATGVNRADAPRCDRIDREAVAHEHHLVALSGERARGEVEHFVRAGPVDDPRRIEIKFRRQRLAERRRARIGIEVKRVHAPREGCAGRIAGAQRIFVGRKLDQLAAVVEGLDAELALRDLERTKRYVAGGLEIYFDDINDASERIWDMLENFKEIIEALEATNEAVLSHRLNDVLRVLTAFSVIVLPLTLIASVMGMNVRVPGEGQISGFWIAGAIMAAVLIAMVTWFRRRGWL